ncbi:TlpA disulfide reductase family protein [Xanthomonas sp. NCPPB 2654]|uniref:TlpA disulfide reductase family protein n=1 Tax=unclassified Xanthomonas TaxID=2643310 RepID=UPI0021E0E990|nr:MULTISPECIES: TlpA disulfide reductase family protein [unclassified Xanthomonas]MDL5367522.1 TlpA disulfide reductase family protein [Xanthomonas sp. NCPPB 2654]MDR6674188.1 thiol-disulfide isomerase/thioredoxin [Xanthomonas translucens]UYC21263.1 TlpA family protein disulfide reductase [Xanthomonas sp. CFBP 8443]
MKATPPRLLAVAAVAAVLGVAAAQLWWRVPTTSSPTPATGTATTAPAAPARVAAARPGDMAPALRLPTLDGGSLTLERFRGRPLLVNVWASWCEPCVREMPELDRLAQAQPADGLQVLGIALDRPEDVRAFLQRVPIAYPIALETPGPADASVRLGDTQGLLPYSVLIGADGRIVRQKLGPFAPGEAERWARLP